MITELRNMNKRQQEISNVYQQQANILILQW
jgi:hypothetical protein